MPLKSFRRSAVSVLAVMLLCALPARAQLPPPGNTPPPLSPILSKLDPLLLPLLSTPLERSLVIVRAADAASVDAVRQLVEQAGGTPRRALPIIEGLAAEVPNASLGALTRSSLVQRIALDRLTLGSLDRTAASVGAPAVRDAFGYDGRGIGVAVIDSGITPWHDDLSDPVAPGSQRVNAFVDFVADRTAAYDNYGHGTHVAGVIAGNGYDSAGGRTGIAPAASLIVLKVLDGTGRGRISDVIAALDYVRDHRLALNIRVVNLSVGAGVYESYETDCLTVAAKRVTDTGVIVVASAGNGGRTKRGDRQYGAITAPGNAPWVLTVGAASHMGTIARDDDTIADFSSRGPTAIDRIAKPDVVAPGVGTVSLSSPNSYLYRTRSGARLQGTVDPGYLPYLSLSGTSQAAPVVAGTVALMLQANPLLTPNAVKAVLQYTAESRPGYDALTQGAGFVNARAAVELARHLADPSSTYVAGTDTSKQVIWGTQRVRTGRFTPDANAWGLTVVWGSSTTPAGAAIEWGMVDDPSGTTTAWRSDTSISVENVVWGNQCGGDDCGNDPWSVNDQTVVWGTSQEQEGDTVVWGTTEGDTVVWGTSDNDTVIWDTSGNGVN